MPKYLVTSNTYFEPLSFEEIIKPLQYMQQRHDAAQDAYDTLSLETNALEQYISKNEGDSDARALYDSYKKKLNDLQNNLWNNGVTAQTRRDLAAARAGYASDIARLKTAIQSRQERSKTYWEARHKDPSLLAGKDPGTYGLDEYLRNDAFGQDYYSYSGNAFASEVGADAKARASELLKSPEYANNPELAGYITKIVQNGYTSEEVNNAANAVKASVSGDNEALNNLSGAESILADVLISHLNATGAKGNLSNEDFDRLLEYGRYGLSQAIGQTTISELSDKQWDYNRQLMLQSMRSGRTIRTGANNPPTQPRTPGYSLDDISRYMEAANAKKINKTLKKTFIDSYSEPIIYNLGTGATYIIRNQQDADRLLNMFGRSKLINTYSIPDPDYQLLDKPFTMPNGTQARLHVESTEPGTRQMVFQIKNNEGRWVTDERRTDEFSRDYWDYKRMLNDFSNNNPDIDLIALAVPIAQRQKIYKQYGISEEVPFEYVPAILNTMSKQGNVTPATIAAATEAYKDTRDNYKSNILASFSRQAGGKKKLDKSSKYAFYQVDGYKISDKGIGDLDSVFGTKRDASIDEITALPEDIIQNKVRISVGGKEYAVNPEMLGNDVNYVVQNWKGIIEEAMLPISDPSKAVIMSDEQTKNWIYDVYQLVGDYFELVGDWGVITPKDIVTSPELQAELRRAITMSMNNLFAMPREKMGSRNMQTRSNTSTNPAGYNDNIINDE